MTPSHLIISIITVLWIKGVYLSKEKQVSQSPVQLIGQPRTQIDLTLSHSISTYDTILWYQRSAGDTALKLIAYISYKNPYVETPFKGRFNVSGDGEKTGYLHILNPTHPEDSGEYFGAASIGGTQPAYFGQGTKLTVLDPEIKITPPEVEILKPSDKECKNKKTKKKKKTLVCVAKNFYPDHVSVFWQVDGEDQTNGVATDEAAQRIGSYYRITSRLRVSAKEWFTPGKNFTCVVHFFNGTVTETRENFTVNENAHESGRISREKYLSITRNAILTYGVLVAKSCAYGAFVGVLVWKLQSSAKKHH